LLGEQVCITAELQKPNKIVEVCAHISRALCLISLS
jgi:hypothetical protein